MTNFFTADTHFFHLRANELCNRPFKSVEEMNNSFLANINKVVPANATLWIIGDFCMGANSAENALEFRKKINANKVNLILGNHDYKGHREYSKCKYLENTFDMVVPQWMGKIEGQFMYLNHYASRTWPEQGRKSWMLYGHSHSNLPDDPNALSIDVGMDTKWDGIHELYHPYTMDELARIMSKKVYVDVDHHGGNN